MKSFKEFLNSLESQNNLNEESGFMGKNYSLEKVVKSGSEYHVFYNYGKIFQVVFVVKNDKIIRADRYTDGSDSPDQLSKNSYEPYLNMVLKDIKDSR